MKIYKAEVFRSVRYYIAVENGKDPRMTARENMDDAFDLEGANTFINLLVEVDVFSPELDDETIYGANDEIEDIREQMRGEK